MKLWIDDERPAPDDSWIAFKDMRSLRRFLDTFEINGENEGKLIAEISCDYYLDPRHMRYTGMTAIEEISFFNRYVTDILAPDFKFKGHSSESDMNKRMEQKINSLVRQKV